MTVLDFPDNPAPNQIWPEPPVAGVPQWQWDLARWNRLPATAPAAVSDIPQCGRLVYVSSAELRFVPYNGDEIKIDGGIYQIPAAGLSLGAPTAMNIRYYLYARVFNDNPVLAVSTVGHITDTTPGNEGVEVMQTNRAWSLVGMCRTDSEWPPQYVDTPSKRLVASWFNRRGRTLAATFPATIATDVVGATQYGPTIECLCWANEIISLAAIGQVRLALGDIVQLWILTTGVGTGAMVTLGPWPTPTTSPATVFARDTPLPEGIHTMRLRVAANLTAHLDNFGFTGMVRS